MLWDWNSRFMRHLKSYEPSINSIESGSPLMIPGDQRECSAEARGT
jgi:hypothetical protein